MIHLLTIATFVIATFGAAEGPLQIKGALSVQENYTPAPDAEHNGGCEHPERCWIYGVSGEDEWVIAIGIARCYGQLLTCERLRPDGPPYGA